MSEIKIFELTQKILQESEIQILNDQTQTQTQTQTQIGYWLSKHTKLPIKFLIKGCEEL